MDRRSALRGGLGAAALAGIGTASRADPPPVPGLAEAAGRVGLRFGSASDVAFSDAPPEYRALFRHHCRLFAPLLSWSAVCPRPCETAELGWEDPNIGFARAAGAQLTGAHLLWHQRTPAWFSAIRTRAEAQVAATRHIRQMVSRYRGQVFAWNVVNEAINPRDGRTDGLRRAPFEVLGVEFMPTAFRIAREADPTALLAYNDYSMEMDRSAEARRNALFRLLDRLQHADAPIDAVGLQSHLRLDGGRFDADDFRRFLGAIAARGLKIILSELDVLDLQPGDIAARDAAVAAMYGAFLRAALDEPAVVGVVSWGLSDRYTWLAQDNDVDAARPDGRPPRPLPFDSAFQPKPAFFAMIDAFRNAPARATR